MLIKYKQEILKVIHMWSNEFDCEYWVFFFSKSTQRFDFSKGILETRKHRLLLDVLGGKKIAQRQLPVCAII